MADKVELQKANTIERWWSSQARNHTVEVMLKTGAKAVRFDKYALILDLSDPEQKDISDGLKEHGQNRRSFFLVGGPAKSDEAGRRQKTELLRMIRKIASDNVIEGRLRIKALEHIKALFSNAELATAKLDAATADCDALLQLATETKTLIGLE